MKVFSSMIFAAVLSFGFYLSVFTFPFYASAATSAVVSSPAPFNYEVWIAYWKKADGVAATAAHLSEVTQILPFGYSVRSDGTLLDTAQIDLAPWPSFLAQAKVQKSILNTGPKIVPTVMWSDGAAIYKILSNTPKRNTQIAAIVGAVTLHNFDGIDIDYEGKTTATEPYFSKFLQGLSLALHKDKKILSCSIEPRTPASSLYAVVPKKLSYSNDYTVINSACDEVKVMAYDQDGVDLELNASKGGKNLYMPIADPDWVVKVLAETEKSISPKKIVLGVPTYGREYKVSTTKAGTYAYSMVKSLSYSDAVTLARVADVTPTRDSAGELNFTFASSTSRGLSTYYVAYTDAASIAAKVALAKKYNLSGVAIFKIDGDIDSNIWNSLNLIK